MNKTAADKIAKIQELLAEKNRIEEELVSLVTPKETPKIPTDFSLNKEIARIVDNAGKISAKDILTRLQKEFPAYGIERIAVNSALVYLSQRKKEIKRLDRGIYGKKELETQDLQQ